jgi:hypothetical protein
MHFTMSITLSAEQERARAAILSWYRSPHRKPYFFLTGPAGSGKTQLTKAVLGSVTGPVLCAGPTGKSALVLSQRTGLPSQTIHSLIYKPTGTGGNKEAVTRIQTELSSVSSQSEKGQALSKELKKLLSDVKPMFTLNLDSALRDASLLVVDECFVKGTLVDTPNGPREIQTLYPGDAIINAAGRDTIVAVRKKEANSAIKVIIGNQEVTSSENHVFFTRRGEVIARDLRPDDYVAHTDTCMRLLSESISPEGEVGVGSILHSQLCLAMADYPAKLSESIHPGNAQEVRGSEEELSSLRHSGSSSSNRANPKAEPHIKPRSLQKDKRFTQAVRIQASGSGRQWARLDETSDRAVVSSGASMDSGVHCGNGQRIQALPLQAGYSRSGSYDLDRSGWGQSSLSVPEAARPEKGCFPGFTRVDSVEVLEQGHPGLDKFRDADGKLYLYDIQAASHHSFSIYGYLVHNCSMVPEAVIQDLLSFGIPLLVQGDPFQLAPVMAKSFFKTNEADFCLTQIHRQAEDSPIIHLATLAREGKTLPLGQYGESVVTREVSSEQALNHDQIIVGKNATRHATNAKVRMLLGRESVFPEVGDKLMCLHNDAKVGLMNGGKFTTTSFDDISSTKCIIGVKGDDINGRFVCHKEYFLEKEPDPWQKQKAQCFTYSYAATCHKMQGDQADAVYVLDQSRSFPGQERQWLYTAITRASKRVTVRI